ncbi:uncharacterized protein E0L32_002676 [Thyridium curvatum]|uniref:Uncharacterized protein n=1 Tax=Thyridium curvatum TaxID=1093900 RepID=A0A507BDZ1_9PEZI|nr:uncharacterized protein E0L32_002676 [Thyridium curvatum]TPX18167.1 hypothetical protein E0L32_002676 [Thyridium curvatum]
MASTTLPLKVRLAIRDQWEPEDKPLRKSLAGLRELLGHDVEVEPEWQQLLAELDPFYEDKGRFVAVVAGCVEAWCKALLELLENEANAEWTDTLLEKLKAWSRLRLFIEVSSTASASTSWSNERVAFIINLPKKQLIDPFELYPAFSGALLDCFDDGSSTNNTTKKKPAADDAAPAGAGDDWADVEMDRSTGKPDVKEPTTTAAAAAPVFLPQAASLPRPDHLLLQPPYYLSVAQHGDARVAVTASHAPSLQLLHDYLARWCRTDPQDARRPPAVRCELHASAFGLGAAMHDRLTLSVDERARARFAVNPAIVLALVEGVLGYERVSNGPGEWTFRRGTALRTA